MPNRRQFLQTSGAVGIGYFVAAGLTAQESRSPNERVAMASVGIDGKGQSDSSDAAHTGVMVAICDVDDNKLGAAARRHGFERAKKYNDFRKMLDEMGKSIDAVTVSTPDHCHAPAASMAMQMGKHCFCQKPMTHTIFEARRLGQLAREKNLATQMGNQGTASGGLRKGAAIVKAGALGTVKEAHIWTNRPIWPQGGPRPRPENPPPYLHWDLWLGPAPVRPYGQGYHPFSWRGWWDFGTGALGDMACHTFNLPFMALNLRDPISVQAETSGHNKDSYPKWSVIHFEFPALGDRAAVKVVWYDGGKRPPRDLFDGRDPGGSGSLMVGDKGKLFSPGDYGDGWQLLGGASEPKVTFPNSPGHFEEWVRAIKGGKTPMSNFPDYAGPLTETMLLGNLAVWVAASGKGEKVEWDAKELKATNIAGLEPIIRMPYRQGYSL
ncbi:MAG: Gfo/Idh/MocA family oxidoreductase [Thermoguttaceae bacterium]|jgi:predicted dehydrogenase